MNPGSGSYFQGTKSSSLDAFIAQFDIATSLVNVKELNNELNSALLIFPNPTNNILNIQFKDQLTYSIHIIDIFGRIIKSIENQNSSIVKCDVSNLPKGTYIVKGFNNEGMSVQKLIIN